MATRTAPVGRLRPRAGHLEQADDGSHAPPGRRSHASAAILPTTLLGAVMDWSIHFAAAPTKQWELVQQAMHPPAPPQVPGAGAESEPSQPSDTRFRDPAWQTWPYRSYAQAFLRQEAWWEAATTGVPGVTKRHERMVRFAARQWLDMVAPSNFLTTNPEAQRRTVLEAGMNLVRGAAHAMEDAWRDWQDLPPAGAKLFEVGRNVAVTPGQVVLRNQLIELIQYAPSTPTVRPEPILLVPAWIMKYYVLDLSAHDSVVRYLRDQGFCVFAISWKNPGPGDRELGMEDYLRLGVFSALEAIAAIVPRTPVHAVGYCLGGTLLAMAAAALARAGRTDLRTVTLLAAQTDFTEPGEIGLFVDEAQVAYLEHQMWHRGYLDKREMKATFQMLRSRDLIWSHRLHSRLLGERAPVTDLMAWNADGTRLPYRMHMEYLRGLFMDNALARGEWKVGGCTINLADINVPVFNVATELDHVSPWRSVFKLQALTDADQTFVLTSGGHNVGIINPPGQFGAARYRLKRRVAGDTLLAPDEWLDAAKPHPGSWWRPWSQWLSAHSAPRRRPPSIGAADAGFAPLEAAPGRYVLER